MFALVFGVAFFVVPAFIDGAKPFVSPPKKTDAEKALEAGTLNAEDSQTVSWIKREGQSVTLDSLQYAKRDGPSDNAYALYAEVAVSPHEILNPVPSDSAPHSVMCFSYNDDDGRRNLHTTAYYNEGHMYIMYPELAAWLMSGCADAIRSKGTTVNHLQYYQIMLTKMPPKDTYYQWLKVQIREVGDRKQFAAMEWQQAIKP